MTRDEAIKKFETNSEHYYGTYASDWVDLFIALGMLKLDEPKSAEERVRDQARCEDIYDFKTELFMRVVDHAGLKIVDK
jgi:hypothetical protein